MSGWDDFKANGSDGDYVKLNIGDTRELQIVDCRGTSIKVWDDGKTSTMVTFSVHDQNDPTEDGSPRTLDVPVRRARPLGELREALAADGVDIGDRILSIECYAMSHPTRPGRRIGKWRVTDMGPATAAAGAPHDDAPPMHDDAIDDATDAIMLATDVDDCKSAFAAAWKSTRDAGERAQYQRAYQARLSALGDDDLPPL